MKLQILSEIHLEFAIRGFEFSGSDIIILAGDIHLGTKGFQGFHSRNPRKPLVSRLKS